MGRKLSDPDSTGRASRVPVFTCLVSFLLAYALFTVVLRTGTSDFGSEVASSEGDGWGDRCCTGIDNLELWGITVKWGSNFRLNSSEECCRACKDMCIDDGGRCLCDSWVFCGNKDTCGSRFGECWLKKQKDTLSPELVNAGEDHLWTSGIIFGEEEGIIGLKTDHGTIRIKLHPDCAPHSVSYILKLLQSQHCAGCHIYRAEGRGQIWDSSGNHIQHAGFGPPFALLQGTLKASGVPFSEIPKETGQGVRIGSVAWVGPGPDFFISLANHDEWRDYTVFGSVMLEDLWIAETIARLQGKPDVWKGVPVSVLETPVRIRRVQRTETDIASGS